MGVLRYVRAVSVIRCGRERREPCVFVAHFLADDAVGVADETRKAAEMESVSSTRSAMVERFAAATSSGSKPFLIDLIHRVLKDRLRFVGVWPGLSTIMTFISPPRNCVSELAMTASATLLSTSAAIKRGALIVDQRRKRADRGFAGLGVPGTAYARSRTSNGNGNGESAILPVAVTG